MGQRRGSKASGVTALNSADPPRNFQLTTDERIRALTIGVPAWAARKRKIEDDEDRVVDDLLELYDRLVATTPSSAEAAVEAAAKALDLTKLNELVAKHNRYYPIEANLPMSRTGEYLAHGRVWRREEPYTAARILGIVRMRLEERAAADSDE